MPIDTWATKSFAVASLHLDAKNPRLGRETLARAPRDIIQYLFRHDKALDVAESIASRGFFPNEPLLAVKEDGRLIVVEGNRRLAALKALREPGLLEGPLRRQVERLSSRMSDSQAIATVPVTVAPSRRATDRQIAARHIGNPVLPWQAENRARFILDKLEENYTNAQLLDELGFSVADIQKARQTRAIADMARSLDLPEAVRAKLENPRAKIFTTIERVFDSSVGREFLKVEPNAEYGLRGNTTRSEFVRGFTKLVADVASGRQSSRSLNTNENIETYFRKWKPGELPASKPGSFVPSDVIAGRSMASARTKPGPAPSAPKSAKASGNVLPRSFRVRYGNPRLVDIRDELVKLERIRFRNSGAVLLRVFFELAVLDYLERTGELGALVKKLEEKGKLPFGTPAMKQLVPEVIRVARQRLSKPDAMKVEKAVKYDPSAPFTLSDLHGFVHQSDLPSERDILQFWLRTEPLFRLMLEQAPPGAKE